MQCSRGHRVHKVVWGCKHPRLEAAFQTELSVWCLLPPTASCSPPCARVLVSPFQIQQSWVVAVIRPAFGSCKHPTLSCDRRPQRLREGCLLAPAGSERAAGSSEPDTSRLNGPGRNEADQELSHSFFSYSILSPLFWFNCCIDSNLCEGFISFW